MKCTGKITDVSMDYRQMKPIVSICLDSNGENIVNAYKDAEKLSIEIKKYRKKRSLDANAYLWSLCEMIARSIGSAKEEVYKKAVRDVGVFDYVLLVEKAADRFISNWKSKGIGWFAEKLDNAKIDGCVKVIAYYGSSTYDTKEMSRLIDYLIDEAYSLGLFGIGIQSEEEIEHYKKQWKTETGGI